MHFLLAASRGHLLSLQSLPCTWMQLSKRGKDSGLGHTWALEQQEMGLSQAAF